MHKPVSVSLKDYLMPKVAEEVGMEERLCNTIISWSFAKVKDATEHCNSIEISGFGKLLTSNKKIERRIKVLLKTIQALEKDLIETRDGIDVAFTEQKLESSIALLKYFKTKRREDAIKDRADMGRMEE